MRKSIVASALLAALALITTTRAQGWLPRSGVNAWKPSDSVVAVRIDGREYRVSVTLTANDNTTFRLVPINGRWVTVPNYLPPTTTVNVAMFGADGLANSPGVFPTRASVRSAFRPLMQTTLAPKQIQPLATQAPIFSQSHFQGTGQAFASLTGFIVSIEVKTRSGTKVIDVPVSRITPNVSGPSIPV